ncbi:hypothetical protein Cni_G00879 [Canna indica]|uniref:Endonuclease/exonuclease/phosphatase domain-containing protein n=1 Tax=Canna indica TaxID=4628 RepID=A0AAQ3JN94_9LILI|nr:hypothetical protein Cni_G00879 [Canna indica]
MRRVVGSNKFDFSFHNSVGLSSGQLIAWNMDIWEGVTSFHGKHFIGCLLLNRCTRKELMVVNVYGPPNRHKKASFCVELEKILGQTNHETIVGGDFNVTHSDSERFNCLGNVGDSALFSSIISDLTFADLPILGRQYTWYNNHSSPASAQLDRILVGKNFASSFTGCVVKVGNPKLSDHAPLTLSVQGSRTNLMFRFEHFWLALPSFADTMKDCWTSELRRDGSAIGTWILKCRLLISRLRIWSKGLVNANKDHIVDLESRLESKISTLEGPEISNSSSPPISSSSSTFVFIFELCATLDNCYEAENTYWRQIAKVRWLKEEDKNTKFFHCIASGRMQKNWISSLNENGRIIDGEKDIAAAFNSFFKNSIGTARAGRLLPDWGALYEPTSSDFLDLILPCSEEEVLMNLKQMGKVKVLGPDGPSDEFSLPLGVLLVVTSPGL